MKKIAILFLAVIFLSSTPSYSFEFKKLTKEEKEVKSLLKEHNKALYKKDLETLSTFYHESYKNEDGYNLSEMIAMIEKATKAFEELMTVETDGRFRTNLIKFLSDRVTFLNSKIDCVTGGSAERRLVMFLKNSSANNNGEIEIGMSMTALAHALDIGRASLYRILSSLEKKGLIKTEPKKIIFIDPKGLERILK